MERPDPSNIFKGTAWYYARYRRRYSQQIFSDIVAYYALNEEGTLLDLGCGTGELTIPLSQHFETAVGIDPSTDMLSEARSQAKKERVSNIQWIKDRAENVNESLGPVRLTTSGVSFHWMDQPIVLEKVYNMTESGGGMVVFGDISPVRGRSKTEDWETKRKEIIEKYLGTERRAGDKLHKDFIPEERSFEEIFKESPFRTFELKQYPYQTERTIDGIIGFLYSTSYANRELLGDKASDFEQELREELLKLVPSNRFVEQGQTDAFFLRK